jgi:glycosyltransferase involved in cell wall biosynthesis
LSDLVTEIPRKLLTLHVNTQGTWRGGEQQTLYLLEGLRSRGHEVVLATRPDSPLAERARGVGLEVLPIRPLNEGDPAVVFQLVRWMRRRRPHLAHVHASHAHLLMWLASFLTPRIPVVVTRRVDLTIYRRWTMRINALKYRCRIGHFIAVSRAVRARLLRDGVSTDRVTVVPSGVRPRSDEATHASTDAIRRELKIPETSRVVFSVGALVRGKGYATLVDAAARVLKSVDAAFVIAGVGRELDALRLQAERLGLGERLRFLGFRDDIHSLLRVADVYVQPSFQEALGTSIQDAMFLGMPVVASRVGGIPELVDDGVHGLLVPPGEAEPLGDALVELLSSEERRKAMGQAGQARVEAEFGVDEMIDGTLGVYRRVLDAPL